MIFLSLLLLSVPALGRAQDAEPTVSRASRFFSHFDAGISGTAFFTKDVSGTVNNRSLGNPYPMTQSASAAAGFLGIIRAQKSPYKGLEFTYGYGRLTESFSCCNQDSTTGAYNGPFTSQNTASEYSLGYLARPDHEILGFKPFISGGVGILAFTPTKYGGHSLPQQARMTYYYHVGGERMVTESFGVRVGFRQLFYKAPDFGQNYLTILKTTFTSEPEAGVFVHF